MTDVVEQEVEDSTIAVCVWTAHREVDGDSNED